MEDLQLFSSDEKKIIENEDKILGALGLARNAGALAIGSDAVELAMRSGKARIVFIANDISRNSMEKLQRLIQSTGTKYMILPCSTEILAKRLGKSGFTATAALTKPGFEKIIFKALSNKTNSHDNTTEVQ